MFIVNAFKRYFQTKQYLHKMYLFECTSHLCFCSADFSANDCCTLLYFIFCLMLRKENRKPNLLMVKQIWALFYLVDLMNFKFVVVDFKFVNG